MAKNQIDNKIIEVATRIRAARDAVGLSVDEISASLAMSKEEYLRYETGREDFSFTFIYRVSSILGVEITDLMEGQSPSLSNYTVTRRGEGSPIVRREGFAYNRLAPLFKNKLAEPFLVKIPYSADALNEHPRFSTHKGQEIDIVIKGCMKITIGDNSEILHEGDCIYYDSSNPHYEIALGGEECEIYAIVINPDGNGMAEFEETVVKTALTNTDLAKLKDPVMDKFIETTTDEHGVFNGIKYKNAETFNFAFDVVDAIAEKDPNKLAMLHLSREKTERRFTFEDISRHSSMTANYFKSLGIKKGSKVMLVLKRHYQFWFSILALHKIGAVVIPATNLLVEHDFDYRYKAAEVDAIVCTSDGDVSSHAELAAKNYDRPLVKIIVGGKREGWHDFDSEYKTFSDVFPRPSQKEGSFGHDLMLMFFTSGTTGYPKIAMHSNTYALGHFATAKYWHNIDPNGIHLTVSDTGWGKALWGKLYGQWMCESAIFTYDFDRFDAHDMLSVMQDYKITTFCAPPTIFRFFIKENLSKYDLSSIKYATVAGEALNPEVYHQFLKATGVRLMEGFGQTETTLTIANFVGTFISPGSMGKPNPQYDVQILDDNAQPVKVGEVGEICIRTDEETPFGLFSGYYNQPEKTAEVWHDGYYHTGDTAWRDENGMFWYVGRVDDLIKSSGYRIGPFEIESVIMELPYVLECAVTAAKDEIRGQVVKATIVLTKGTIGTDELKKEIQKYVKTHTAPYKYPRIVEFRESLPKTISGKIRRVELKQ